MSETWLVSVSAFFGGCFGVVCGFALGWLADWWMTRKECSND